MRIAISTFGSRGDVEPMAALAVALEARGAEVRLCAPPDGELEEMLARAGVALVPAFTSVHEWVAMARRSGLRLPQLAAIMIDAHARTMAAMAEGVDAIVATGLFPSKAAAQAVADRRGIRHVSVHFCPRYLPSAHHPPVAFPGWPHPPGVTDPRALWARNDEAMNALFGEAVNGYRASIGLATLRNVRDPVFTPQPWLASDPVLGPWQPTDLCDAIPVGAWILPDARPLPAALRAFLDAGAPPIYVGFGSMATPAVHDAARSAIAAVRAQGHRIVLARGWAALEAIDAGEDCHVVGELSQQALFPRVAAVIHHGGAGTTAAAARAGAPQLIVPQVADQPYWAGRIAALGIGAAHDGAVPSVESLSTGLSVALAPETRERATVVARTIRTDGAETAAAMLLATA